MKIKSYQIYLVLITIKIKMKAYSKVVIIHLYLVIIMKKLKELYYLVVNLYLEIVYKIH